MKQKEVPNIHRKPYPLDPQFRAYFQDWDKDKNPGAELAGTPDRDDDHREWQNPSRFGRHHAH